LFWECQTVQESEAFPNGFVDNCDDDNDLSAQIYWLSLSFWKSQYLRILTVADQGREASYMRAIVFWRNVVSTYSSCLLTKPEDKLVAISAVAQDLQKFIKSRYLAGLWEKEFANQLLWRISHRSSKIERPYRPNEYRAPTWSWASLGGEVDWLTERGNAVLIEVKKVDIQLKEPNDFGQVLGGSPQISGKLVKGWIGSSKLWNKPIPGPRWWDGEAIRVFFPDKSEISGSGFTRYFDLHFDTREDFDVFFQTGSMILLLCGPRIIWPTSCTRKGVYGGLLQTSWGL